MIVDELVPDNVRLVSLLVRVKLYPPKNGCGDRPSQVDTYGEVGNRLVINQVWNSSQPVPGVRYIEQSESPFFLYFCIDNVMTNAAKLEPEYITRKFSRSGSLDPFLIVEQLRSAEYRDNLTGRPTSEVVS